MTSRFNCFIALFPVADDQFPVQHPPPESKEQYIFLGFVGYFRAESLKKGLMSHILQYV